MLTTRIRLFFCCLRSYRSATFSSWWRWEQIFGFFELVPARFGPGINCRISPGWTPLFGTRVLNSPIGLPAACASTVTLDELFLFYFFFPIHVVRKKHGLNVFFYIFLMEGRFYIVIGEAKNISDWNAKTWFDVSVMVLS